MSFQWGHEKIYQWGQEVREEVPEPEVPEPLPEEASCQEIFVILGFISMVWQYPGISSDVGIIVGCGSNSNRHRP